MAKRKSLGILRITQRRKGVKERIRKIILEIKTAPKALCHGIFCPKQTAKVK